MNKGLEQPAIFVSLLDLFFYKAIEIIFSLTMNKSYSFLTFFLCLLFNIYLCKTVHSPLLTDATCLALTSCSAIYCKPAWSFNVTLGNKLNEMQSLFFYLCCSAPCRKSAQALLCVTVLWLVCVLDGNRHTWVICLGAPAATWVTDHGDMIQVSRAGLMAHTTVLLIIPVLLLVS